MMSPGFAIARTARLRWRIMSTPCAFVPYLRRRLFWLPLFLVSGLAVGNVRAQDPGPGVLRQRPLPEPADPKLPSLVLVGDSTVRNGEGDGANGQWGWGEPLAALFDSARINVVNRALGGRSTRTYITQGLWDQTLAVLKPGDFLMIQFGHNDSSAVNDASRARGTLPGTGDETQEIDNLLTKQHEVVHTYGWYLRKYLADAKAKGVTPVVCSPVPRKIWKDGRIERASQDYGKWAAEVARDAGVAFVDLNEIIARRYEELGPAAVEALFADEHTHTTRAGAEIAARCVVLALKGLADCPPCRFLSAKADTPSALTVDPGLPHLEQHGGATQPVLNGRPGGE